MNKTEEFMMYIEEAIAKHLPRAQETDPRQALITSMRYSLLNSGKRIRPILTLAFCELCDGDAQSAVDFACAIEMVHTYSLIHDDLPCMDNDVLRRGKACNHIVYGEAIALLAGDALLTKAFELVMSANLSAEKRVAAAEILARFSGAAGMIGGQCIDLQSSQQELTMETLKQMDMGKTVALISAACQMGCVAAGADETVQKAALAYAEGIGMAFQIQDDILDVIGSKEELGKSVGADQANQKKNYVSLLGLEQAKALVKSYTEQAIHALNFAGEKANYLKELAENLSKRRH
ncbi:polyprenyl synthetase family protein [Scatolibacter rhodanostii]|uniref:polyprenyl synthetase family protein n=1 Tax=Scatolibacter rhodanostii TaxID=2014781 RepID=UPI000C086326|nr:farnesyl diphosphate synthase [Scatolibacter rhodanostii]